ncbi:MAG: hypothetical protein WCP52_02320 [Bacteroidota bacterium]
MKKQLHFISILLFFLSFNCTKGFSLENNMVKTPFSESMDEGNKLLSNGQFSSALTIWQKLLEQDALNANINFKLGMCYFNSIDEQSKALPYFRKASKTMVQKYDFFNNSEKAAPYDVLYFLSQTYLANNQPDSALLMLFQYDDKSNGNPSIPVDKAIRNCINAKNASKSPRDVTMKNPGKNVNSTFSETNPVLTIDNSVMFFASRRAPKDGIKKISNTNGKFDEDIYFTMKDAKGNWEPPIAFKWNTDKDEAPLCLSADGLTLYIRKDINGQADVFQSNYIDKVWSQPKPVSEINSSSNETGVSVSADGKYLYFCSDKEGGIGKFDIYQCVKTGSKWGKPKNLGDIINTNASEISPFINPNGKTLFFSSNGNKDGMGGYDIFYSEMKEDGNWSAPQTMGFPINTTRDDINYYIIGGGTRYYSTIREEADSYDIFKIEGGGFSMENIDATGQVVTLTKEMSVSDVVEVNKTVEKEVDVVETVETTVEVIKEVERVDVEKEKRKMDSMLVVARKEVNAENLKTEAEKVKADAERVKAEAAIKTAEAEKAKAEAEGKKADAAKAQADAERTKSEAIKATAEAAKAKADAVMAAAQKAASDAVKAKADADKAKADAAASQAITVKVKAEADKATAEANKAKADTDKTKAIADKAKADENALNLKNQLAETEKPKYEALKIQSEAAKSKAEADKLKSQEVLANAQKAQAEALKAKSESDATKATAAAQVAQATADNKKAEVDKLKAQADIANAEKAKADATKAAAIAQTTQATADNKKAEADKLKAQADIANAEKAKADATKAAAIAQTSQATADAKKAEVDKLKAQADIANAEKVKADAAKATAIADKAKADADKALADANAKKSQAEIASAEKSKADAARAASLAEKSKTDAEAAKAKLEILKLQPPAPKPTANPTQKGK